MPPSPHLLTAPRPSLRNSASGGSDTINITPMLDVIFNLLFFFFLATVARREIPNIEINLPRVSDVAAARAVLPESTLLVTIGSGGNVWVDLDRVRLPADPPSAAADAPTEDLATRLTREDRTKKPDLLIRVDKVAQSGVLLEVLQACRAADYHSPMIQHEHASTAATPP